MRMKSKKLFALLSVSMIACLLPTACSYHPLVAYDTFAHFNVQTRWVFVSQNQEHDKAVWQEITALETAIEKSVSLSEEESAVSRFNRANAGERIEIDKTAYDIIKIARDAYDFTKGAYNPAVGIYIDLWGFSPRCMKVDYLPSLPYDRDNYTEILPDGKYIEAFQRLTDFSTVKIEENDGAYYLTKPNVSVEVDGETYTMALNLGGIAKGYCADETNKIVRREGYNGGYVSYGASSLVVLKNPSSDAAEGDKWAIGVNSPRDELGLQYMNIPLKDTVLSSSGDSEQFYELGGTRYCHIIDPATGYPVNALSQDGIVCATVYGISGAMGDAVATALHVMGREKAVSFAREKLSDYGVCFVYSDGQGAYTLYTNLPENGYRLLSDRVTAVAL